MGRAPWTAAARLLGAGRARREFLAVKAQDPRLHLSAHLAAQQEPDDRIDIVRPIWLKQMERNRKEVAGLRRRRKPAAAPAIAPSLVDA
jgi:hypothetical protein